MGDGCFTGAYLDDLIIYSSSWTDHMSHLHHALERLVGGGGGGGWADCRVEKVTILHDKMHVFGACDRKWRRGT